MKQLKINRKILQYVGKPLTVDTFDGKYWSGRSNFLCSNEKTKTEISLLDLNNCFEWAKIWSHDSDYVCGYVLDYSTKTIYYDKQEALDHLLKVIFPKRKEEGYFENFILKDFSK